MAKRKTLTTDAAALKRDGWENLLTGAADMYRDKREAARPISRLLTYEGARSLWRSDDTAALIVQKPADDMVRKWFDVSVKADPSDPNSASVAHEIQEATEDALKTLRAPVRFRDGLRYARAYGGGGILIGLNDGVGLADLIKPVNENAIRSVDYLTAFDVRELQVLTYYSNPLAANFGEPQTYRVNPRALGINGSVGVVDVHESRILRFAGAITSRDDLLYNQGWGDSVLGRVFEVIRDYGLSWSGAAALIQDFAQAVYKIKGLAAAVAQDREQTVIKRLKLMDLSRSYLRGIVLDADGEDFERKPTPMSGLPDILDRFVNRLAQAADMPVAMITGQAPAGLNATGSENTRYYYDGISSKQQIEVTPPAERLVRYLFLAKQGPTKGKVPEAWSIVHRPLWQLDAKTEADKRLATAQADAVYLTNGVVTPEEVRKRFEGDTYSDDLRLSSEDKDAFDDVDPSEGEGDPSLTRDPKAAADPSKPALPGAPTDAGAKAQDTALNGAQVTSAVEIVKAVAAEQLPRDAGIAMLAEFFNLAPERAEKIMGSVGKGFKPKEPEPPPAAPGVPGAKPSAPKPPAGGAP
jgi:phage-related protein (TIGR01555 family)